MSGALTAGCGCSCSGAHSTKRRLPPCLRTAVTVARSSRTAGAAPPAPASCSPAGTPATAASNAASFQSASACIIPADGDKAAPTGRAPPVYENPKTDRGNRAWSEGGPGSVRLALGGEAGIAARSRGQHAACERALELHWQLSCQ